MKRIFVFAMLVSLNTFATNFVDYRANLYAPAGAMLPNQQNVPEYVAPGPVRISVEPTNCRTFLGCRNNKIDLYASSGQIYSFVFDQNIRPNLNMEQGPGVRKYITSNSRHRITVQASSQIVNRNFFTVEQSGSCHEECVQWVTDPCAPQDMDSHGNCPAINPTPGPTHCVQYENVCEPSQWLCMEQDQVARQVTIDIYGFVEKASLSSISSEQRVSQNSPYEVSPQNCH